MNMNSIRDAESSFLAVVGMKARLEQETENGQVEVEEQQQTTGDSFRQGFLTFATKRNREWTRPQ